MKASLSGAVFVTLLSAVAACGSTSNDSGASAGAGGQSDGGVSDGAVPDAAQPDAVGDSAFDATIDGADAGGCTLEPDTSGTAHAIAKAACTPHADCCAQIGLGYDQANCVKELAASLQSLFDAARCRGAQYDPAALVECVAAVEAYSQSCPAYLAASGIMPAFDLTVQKCSRVVTGTQQPGQSCDSNFDCAQTEGSMTWCLTTLSGTSYCQRTTYGTLGESCDPFGDPIRADCNEYDGLTCSGDSCVALANVGEPCFKTHDCVLAAYCEQGSCQLRKTHGSACAGEEHCERGLVCLDGSCGGSVGDSCAAGLECASKLCIQGKCAPTNGIALQSGLDCE